MKIAPIVPTAVEKNSNSHSNDAGSQRSSLASTASTSTTTTTRSSTTSVSSSSRSSRRVSTKVDGDRVRNRLLSRLGIFQQQSPQQQHQQQQRQRRISPLRKVAPLTEPLKFHDEDKDKHNKKNQEKKEDSNKADDDDSFDNATAEASPFPSSPRKSVVAFDNQVSVVPIPKHQEYSKRIRSRLWCDKKELRTMVALNTLEYQSEGWNPSTVVEDEGFITMSTGERIHPVHLQRLLASPFMMMRPPMRVMQLQPPMDVRPRPML